MRFLATEDDDERLVLAALARRAVVVQDALMRNQAQHTINALAKALRRNG